MQILELERKLQEYKKAYLKQQTKYKSVLERTVETTSKLSDQSENESSKIDLETYQKKYMSSIESAALRSIDNSHIGDRKFFSKMLTSLYSDDSETLKHRSVRGTASKIYKKDGAIYYDKPKTPITPEKRDFMAVMYHERLKKFNVSPRDKRYTTSHQNQLLAQTIQTITKRFSSKNVEAETLYVEADIIEN